MSSEWLLEHKYRTERSSIICGTIFILGGIVALGFAINYSLIYRNIPVYPNETAIHLLNFTTNFNSNTNITNIYYDQGFTTTQGSIIVTLSNNTRCHNTDCIQYIYNQTNMNTTIYYSITNPYNYVYEVPQKGFIDILLYIMGFGNIIEGLVFYYQHREFFKIASIRRKQHKVSHNKTYNTSIIEKKIL